MRVLTFDVPPQEVKFVSVLLKKESYPFLFSYLSSLTAGHSYLKVIFQILTKDSVTVFVDAIMYYKVVLMF